MPCWGNRDGVAQQIEACPPLAGLKIENEYFVLGVGIGKVALSLIVVVFRKQTP